MTLANLRSPALGTAAGLLLGYAVDALVGDPRRGHPVAAFGRMASWVERRTYASRRGAGVTHVGLLVGGSVVLGTALGRAPGGQVARVVVTGAATWTVLGGRSLRREAAVLAGQLEAGDLAAARVQVTHLVGRDPSRLDADELARACVESVAENTSDAVVAPLLWGAVAGVPGLLAYRAANTLDAMVGHRSERYLRFGWAAARFDDLLNLGPARVAGLLAAAAAPLVGGSPRAALAAVRRDAARHPSPNAGVVEAAFAGALGVRLGGVNVYGGEVEDRGTLGDGRTVEVGDVQRAVRLSRAVSVLSLAVAVGLTAVVGRFPWDPLTRSRAGLRLSVPDGRSRRRVSGSQGRTP
ncbi:cobalamin biosynthesis protein [Microlunatus spumicola]|uniref:Cobalamin biosynthesis protein CobD n=1 Tax=Microlunatus spumicola TaxID=81499 RepID=A0ABP6XD69_9ACTN